MFKNVQTYAVTRNRRPEPYAIDPDTDFYTAGLIFNRLEAEYQRARAGAGL